jgi:hypothetical protein
VPAATSIGILLVCHAAGNIMVHLDPPRGTRALYERVAELIGLKVTVPGGFDLTIAQHMNCTHN